MIIVKKQLKNLPSSQNEKEEEKRSYCLCTWSGTKDAVWIDRSLIRRRWVIRMLNIWILVSCIGWRWIVEMKCPTFPIIWKMQWSKASSKTVGTIIKTRHPAAQVKMVHYFERRRDSKWLDPMLSSSIWGRSQHLFPLFTPKELTSPEDLKKST